MKIILALALTIFAFSAQATDKKIGNVIAVERQITNIYDSCIETTGKSAQSARPYFICSVKYLQSPHEVAVGKGGVIRFQEQGCSVQADTDGGFLFIVYGKSEGNSDFQTAKACLQSALEKNKTVSAIVYTVEQ